MRLGDLIREYREKNSMSMGGFAKKSGISSRFSCHLCFQDFQNFFACKMTVKINEPIIVRISTDKE